MTKINLIKFGVVAVAAASLIAGSVAMAGPSASDGDGTMTVSPTSVVSASTNNDFTFHFTNNSGYDFSGSSQLTLTVPSGWTTPQDSSSSTAGFVTIANANCGNNPKDGKNDIHLSSNTITVDIGGCNNNNSFDLQYDNLTAPATATSSTFTTETENGGGHGHSLTPIGVSPIVTVTSAITATTLTPSDATGTYGGTVDLSATLASSSPISGKTIQFSLNNTPVGSSTTNSSGVATLTGVSLSGIAAGTHSGYISASFAGDSNYASSTGTATLTVSKANPTIIVTPYSVTYDGSAHTATGSATGVSSSSLNSDLDLSGTTHTNAGSYNSDPWTFTDVTGNYNNATGIVADLISQATPTLSVTNPFVTYNGSPQAADITSSVDGTVSNIKYNGTTTVPTDPGTYAITVDLASTDANYSSLTGATTSNNFSIIGTDDATLSTLTVSAGTLTPSFSSGMTSYTDVLPHGTTTTPTVAATTNDPLATASTTQASGLPGTATVLVIAQNGATNTYTVDFSVAADSVFSLSPAFGPEAGGTNVTITGSGFSGATAVAFGGTPAASFTVASDTLITAVSPAGTGTVDMTVTTPGGTSLVVTADQFIYIPSTEGLLNVILTVDNSAGGSAVSSDFTVSVLASGASTSSFPGDTLGTPVLIDANANYNVNVSSVTNYGQAKTNCDNNAILGGSSAMCTITETFSAPAGGGAPTSGGRTLNTITVTQGSNGTISPATLTDVPSGANETFAIAPALGYKIADVLVDGVSTGAVSNYTFTGVNGNHSITASFSLAPVTPPTTPTTTKGTVLGASTTTPGQVLGASTFNFTGDLSLGSLGPDVTELQTLLTQLGFYMGPITGQFGPLTFQAVKAFQKKYGLPVTGFMEPLTRAKLNALINGQVLGARTTTAQTQLEQLQLQLLALLQQLLALLQAQVGH